MSADERPERGAITWIDLTVPNADEVKHFYAEVTGWRPEPVSMGDYDDWNMTAPGSGRPMAGVCHARGVNAELPPHWMIYINVSNLDRSIAMVEELGGALIRPATTMGDYGRYCIIRDPAGAVAALFEPAGGTK